MKKSVLKRIKAVKTRRAGKRVRRHPSPAARDPKDLRGAKGALLVDAAEAAQQEDFLGDQEGPRHHPIRIPMDW